MKSMKKILVLTAVLGVLCAFMCVNAFAVGETIDSITPADGENVTFDANSTKFDMTYTTGNAGKDGMFLVLVLKAGTGAAPRAEDILYVNQTTADGTEVSFTAEKGNEIYPSAIEDGSQIYLAGTGLGELKLMGTIETPAVKIGDVNGDGCVDVTDVNFIRLYMLDRKALTNEQLTAADVDHTAEVNVTDVNIIRLNILGRRELE